MKSIIRIFIKKCFNFNQKINLKLQILFKIYFYLENINFKKNI